MKTLHKLLGATLLLTASMACTSVRSVVVDFDVAGTGSIDEEPGGEPASRPLVQMPRLSGSLNPFKSLRYEGELFSAVLDLNSDFMRVTVENNSGSALQLRFDQATVMSKDALLPLRVFSAAADGQGVHAGKGRPPIPAMPLALAAGSKKTIVFSASYAGLFDSGRPFGVDFAPGQPVLRTTGVGSSIQYRIPVDHGGRRFTWVVDLSARQASARTSYR